MGDAANGTLPPLTADGGGGGTAPTWVLCCYFASVAVGTAVSLLRGLCFLAGQKTGFHSLILQLCLGDLLLLFVAAIEVITLYYQTWMLSSEMCMVFRGMEVFANSLTMYTIICINLHVISLSNLHSLQAVVSSRNPLTCKTDSDECLVTKNEKKSVNVNYQKIKTDLSILVPAIITWLISSSLSLPNFTLSTVFNINNTTQCAIIVYNYYGELLYNLMLVFRCAVPLPLLFLSLEILVVKLVRFSKRQANNLTNNNSEIKRLLLFCILVSVTFMVTSFQRYILYFITTIKNRNNSQFPVMYNVDINTYSNIYLSMLHYAGVCCRANLYLFVLPHSLKTCSNIVSSLRNNKT